MQNKQIRFGWVGIAFIAAVMAGVLPQAAAQTTAFTYQGQLSSSGAPASGAYDLTFAVFDADSAGVQVGDTLTNSIVGVSNGLFTVTLDFGAGIFTGPDRWLEIGVRLTGDADFALLSPRQSITPAPQAIYSSLAGAVPDNAITTTMLAGDTVVKSLNGLRDDVTLTAGANVTITPNGNSLTLASAGVGGSGIWSVLNNNAYYNAGSVGIGATNPFSKLAVQTGTGLYGFTHTDGAVTVGSYVGISSSGPTGGWLGTYSPHPLYLFVNNGQPSLTVGIGGSTTMTPLGGYGSTVFGTPNGESGMSIVGGNRADVRFDGNSLKLVAGLGGGPPPLANGLAIDTLGNVGLGKAINFGSTTRQMLNMYGTGFGVGVQTADLYFRSGAGFAWHVGGVHNDATYNPGGGTTLMTLDGTSGLSIAGKASVCTLTVRGGCDLAEPFSMNGAEVEKGSVVVIDEEHPGQLKLSTRAYDARVAGIVSGANGVNTGIALRQEGVLDAGQNVALTGRVYVQADVSNGVIQPGDLLTTSDSPGHAMKVTNHGKAQGAILGKAMSGLKEGKGMVLVLVTLQ